MNTVTEITDKKQLELHLRKNTEMNIYQIGDLDDFFFKNTKWYGLTEEGEIRQTAMVYTGTELPVLLSFCENNYGCFRELAGQIKDKLPREFYSHLSCGAETFFGDEYNYKSGGKHFKMSLTKKNFRDRSEDKNIRRIGPEDIEKLNELYEKAYPANWLDRRMLETGKYFGYITGGKIRGAAGIHVYSPAYRVAALGNIATDPAFRGQSVCRKVTSALCRDLFETVDLIGLNVDTGNAAAIKCYTNCGFEICGIYEEFMFGKIQD